jgi:hypothetical protein
LLTRLLSEPVDVFLSLLMWNYWRACDDGNATIQLGNHFGCLLTRLLSEPVDVFLSLLMWNYWRACDDGNATIQPGNALVVC